MNNDAALLAFKTRDMFRNWLQENHRISNGIWIVFVRGSKDFTANDALEEALCFGWIDGVMKSIDEGTYKKYFTVRKDKKNWSEKNRKIFKKLSEKGLATQAGIEAFQWRENEEKRNSKDEINQSNVRALSDALRGDSEVLRLFEETAPSRQKQLAGFYCEAKSEETRIKRIQKIAEVLKSGYKGMVY